MVEENRNSTFGLVIAAAVLGGLFLLGAVLPRDPDFDLFFGVEAYRIFGTGALAAAFGILLAILLVPGLAVGVARGLGRVCAAIPFRLRMPLLLAASGILFWLLQTSMLSGDAVSVIIRTSLGDVYASNPLTSFINIAVSRALPWSAPEAIRLVSCAFGVLYVYSAVSIAKECFPKGPARSALSVALVCCGTSALYFGSIEVYAPLSAAIGLYLLLGIRATKRGGSILWPALMLGTAFGLHGSAGLLLPSLGYLANRCRLWPVRFPRVALAGLAFLVPVVMVYGALYLFTWGGVPPEATPERFGTFLGGNDQAPILPIRLTATNVLHCYAFLDAEHLVGVLNLVVLAAPAGLLLLLLGRWPTKENPAFRFAATCALFLVAFPFFWNVNFTLRQDWELFSPMGIPLTLMGVLAFLGRGAGSRRAVGVAALSLFSFVPLVLSNRGETYDRRLSMIDHYLAMVELESALPKEPVACREIVREEGERYFARMEDYDPHDAEAKAQRAEVLWRSGDLTTAEAIFRRILANEPRNARASEGLGSVLAVREEMEEARLHLLNALREQPWRLPARINLARIALTTKDEDEAIRQLEIGLRRGGMHHLAGQALFELAELRARRGEAETARVLHALAAERGVTRFGARGGGPTKSR